MLSNKKFSSFSFVFNRITRLSEKGQVGYNMSVRVPLTAPLYLNFQKETLMTTKTKKGEAEKPGGCWEELTCGNVKFHSLFNSYLSTLNQSLDYLNALM